MSSKLAEIQTLSRHISGSSRVANSLRGVVPAAIAMPLVLRVWSPIWFTIPWLIAYLCVSALFATLSLLRPSGHVEQGWSLSTAVLFGSVPVSATIWSGTSEDFWAAATVAVIYIAFEMAALPFLRIHEWRFGVAIVGATTVVCGVLTINPVVALMLAPILVAMIFAADRIRGLKIELEEHLSAAQNTIRHDPLTGLLNRRGLTTVIEHFDDENITVALIDVDRFKLVNDSHGHQFGDQVLIALANELSTRLGEDFYLARLGGDEFVAIARGEVELDPSIARPKRIASQLHQQAVIVESGFSIGVSHGHNVDSAHRLLSEAGFAMRQAKRTGATLARFDGDSAERLDRTVQVAALANGQGEHGRFVPVGQTIVDNERIVGCELLIRWQCPDGKLLSPVDFLPLATEAGMMSTINEMMLEHAVRFAARFNNRPGAPFVSVNISAAHLGDAALCARVETLLRQHRVPAERLMIEITESEQLGGYDGWEAAAARLRASGVSLAIDDFGTGYSSLDRLQHLPITHLKFDRMLVQSVSGPFGEVVGGVTRYANAVNIGIIAEGIETLDELESMRAFGISHFQGYYFHRPAPLDDVEILVLNDRVPAVEGVTRA